MRDGLFNDFKEKCSDRSVTMIVDSSSMLQCNRIQPQPQGTHVIVSWELLSGWESSVSYFFIEAKCIDVWQCESPRLRAGAPRCPPAPTLGQVLSFPTLLNLFHASVWHRNSLQSPWKVIVGSFAPGQWKCYHPERIWGVLVVSGLTVKVILVTELDRNPLPKTEKLSVIMFYIGERFQCFLPQ